MEPKTQKRTPNGENYWDMWDLLDLAKDAAGRRQYREAFRYFNKARGLNDNHYSPTSEIPRESASRERRGFENMLEEGGILLQHGIEDLGEYLETNARKYGGKASRQRSLKANHPRIHKILAYLGRAAA